MYFVPMPNGWEKEISAVNFRIVAIQDRKRVARRRSNCEARFAPRGGFDLDTRRKPQAYLAGAVSDAGIMDIECHFLV